MTKNEPSGRGVLRRRAERGHVTLGNFPVLLQAYAIDQSLLPLQEAVMISNPKSLILP